MARIALNCSCGWNFFIPGSTPGHEVTCPSCGQTVRIPGRKPGVDVPLTAGAIASEVQRRQRTMRMIIIGGVVGVLVIAIIIVLSLRSTPPEDPNLVSDGKNQGLPGLGGGGRTAGGGGAGMRLPDAPPPPPPPPPLYTAAQIDELRHGVFVNVWLINMSTLISECMRFRNLTNEWAQLQADIANYNSKIKYNLQELAKVGEKVGLETYLAQGDQILGFANRDFTKMKPGEAASFIQTWVNSWRAGPALEQVNIVRGEQKMTIYLEFPEETKELLQLLRHPGLVMEGTPGNNPLGETVGITAELVKDINGGFDGLPPGYRGFLNANDRKRMEDLLLSRKGSSEDVDWLKARILGEAIPSFQREAANIRSQVLALEPKLKENVASDVITRKNGSKFEGQILQETPESIKIKGLYGSVTIPRDDIQRVDKGKGAALEFPARYAEASKVEKPAEKLEKLATLLAWCIEKNLKTQKEYVAYVILTLDASNDRARNAVGLARPAITGGILPVPPK